MTTETTTKIREAIKILNIALNQIEVKGIENKKDFLNNPFKNLQKNTIDFYRELKSEFGNEWIERNNPIIPIIERRFWIKNTSDVLQSLKKKGLCEIIYNTNIVKTGSRRIIKFKLN